MSLSADDYGCYEVRWTGKLARRVRGLDGIWRLFDGRDEKHVCINHPDHPSFAERVRPREIETLEALEDPRRALEATEDLRRKRREEREDKLHDCNDHCNYGPDAKRVEFGTATRGVVLSRAEVAGFEAQGFVFERELSLPGSREKVEELVQGLEVDMDNRLAIMRHIWPHYDDELGANEYVLAGLVARKLAGEELSLPPFAEELLEPEQLAMLKGTQEKLDQLKDELTEKGWTFKGGGVVKEPSDDGAKLRWPGSAIRAFYAQLRDRHGVGKTAKVHREIQRRLEPYFGEIDEDQIKTAIKPDSQVSRTPREKL